MVTEWKDVHHPQANERSIRNICTLFVDLHEVFPVIFVHPLTISYLNNNCTGRTGINISRIDQLWQFFAHWASKG
jgi:hypothetical protein